SEGEQRGWEIANYAVVLLGLGVVAVITAVRRRREAPMTLLPPEAAHEAAHGAAHGAEKEAVQ
ncbi:MAG: hypothetical protein GX601_07895, partial [Anaerolineales bacterium]|nr:hypothetical protein [Anaerolineales bacterium]